MYVFALAALAVLAALATLASLTAVVALGVPASVDAVNAVLALAAVVAVPVSLALLDVLDVPTLQDARNVAITELFHQSFGGLLCGREVDFGLEILLTGSQAVGCERNPGDCKRSGAGPLAQR